MSKSKSESERIYKETKNDIKKKSKNQNKKKLYNFKYTLFFFLSGFAASISDFQTNVIEKKKKGKVDENGYIPYTKTHTHAQTNN